MITYIDFLREQRAAGQHNLQQVVRDYIALVLGSVPDDAAEMLYAPLRSNAHYLWPKLSEPAQSQNDSQGFDGGPAHRRDDSHALNGGPAHDRGDSQGGNGGPALEGRVLTPLEEQVYRVRGKLYVRSAKRWVDMLDATPGQFRELIAEHAARAGLYERAVEIIERDQVTCLRETAGYRQIGAAA